MPPRTDFRACRGAPALHGCDSPASGAKRMRRVPRQHRPSAAAMGRQGRDAGLPGRHRGRWLSSRRVFNPLAGVLRRPVRLPPDTGVLELPPHPGAWAGRRICVGPVDGNVRRSFAVSMRCQVSQAWRQNAPSSGQERRQRLHEARLCTVLRQGRQDRAVATCGRNTRGHRKRAFFKYGGQPLACGRRGGAGRPDFQAYGESGRAVHDSLPDGGRTAPGTAMRHPPLLRSWLPDLL